MTAGTFRRKSNRGDFADSSIAAVSPNWSKMYKINGLALDASNCSCRLACRCPVPRKRRDRNGEEKEIESETVAT